MKSILHEKDGTCFLCAYMHQDYRPHEYLEKHHVFGGANRKHSEKAGLTVYLCADHHRTGKEAVHMNKRVRIQMQAYAQGVYEKMYSREEFVKIFGKNYI